MPLAILVVLLVVSPDQTRGQSIVFVSPNVAGPVSLSETKEALKSVEQRHFIAVAQFLAARVCRKDWVQSAEKISASGSENSGVIRGCSKDKAELLGTLLGIYFNQKKVFVFHPEKSRSKGWLVSFRTDETPETILTAMKQRHLPEATLASWKTMGYLIYIWSADARSRNQARKLALVLGGKEEIEIAGEGEFISQGREDRSQKLFAQVIDQAPIEETHRLQELLKSEDVRDMTVK
jgi:hypothetical protein